MAEHPLATHTARRPHRNFLLADLGPRQQEIRDVGASDQQSEQGDRGENLEELCGGRSGKPLAQRKDLDAPSSIRVRELGRESLGSSGYLQVGLLCRGPVAKAPEADVAPAARLSS